MTRLSDLIKAKVSQFPTQEAAAKDFGVTQAIMSQWRSGNEMPSDKRIPQLAEWCGVSLAEMTTAWEDASAHKPKILTLRVRDLELQVAGLLRRVAEMEEILRGGHSELVDVTESSPQVHRG